VVAARKFSEFAELRAAEKARREARMDAAREKKRREQAAAAAMR